MALHGCMVQTCIGPRCPRSSALDIKRSLTLNHNLFFFVASSCLNRHVSDVLIRPPQATGLSQAPAGLPAAGAVDGGSSQTTDGDEGSGVSSPVTVTRDEDFESCLEHALGLMAKEVSATLS